MILEIEVPDESMTCNHHFPLVYGALKPCVHCGLSDKLLNFMPEREEPEPSGDGWDKTFNVQTFRNVKLETQNGAEIYVDSKRMEKALGIARLEEIKDRAKDASTNNRKKYALSEAQKKLNYKLTRDGVNAAIYEKHPAMQVFHKRGKHGRKHG